MDKAPDIVVGFYRNYRSSDDSAIGQFSEEVIADNPRKWSGDHCIDRSLVPGVLFCNRKIDDEQPRLMDIGPTVLDMFGVSIPSHMDGKPLKVADRR